MNYKHFTLGDWIGHINGVIQNETTLDGNEMRDLLEFLILSTIQEPKTDGDCISRKSVFDLMRSLTRWCVRSEDGKFNNVGLLYDDVMFGIERLPSVRPKTGHWKRISMDKYSEHAKYWYRCDRCGKDNLGKTDWCPSCGARMVEPQESEDKK